MYKHIKQINRVVLVETVPNWLSLPSPLKDPWEPLRLSKNHYYIIPKPEKYRLGGGNTRKRKHRTLQDISCFILKLTKYFKHTEHSSSYQLHQSLHFTVFASRYFQKQNISNKGKAPTNHVWFYSSSPEEMTILDSVCLSLTSMTSIIVIVLNALKLDTNGIILNPSLHYFTQHYDFRYTLVVTQNSSPFILTAV